MLRQRLTRSPSRREPRARELLAQYIAAFENADAATLERVLRHDAALEMVGSRTWFAGRTTCLPYIATYVLGSPGDWRMLAIIANGQPAAAAYCRDGDGALRAFGIAVLDRHPDGHRADRRVRRPRAPRGLRPAGNPRGLTRITSNGIVASSIVPAPVELAIDKYSGAAGKSLERRAKPTPPRRS